MRRRSRASLVIAMVLAMFLGPAAIGLYTDWLWFGETGYRDAFLRVLATQTALGLVGGAVALVVLAVNVRIATHAIPSVPTVIVTRDGPIVLDLAGKRPQAIFMAAASLFPVVCGLYASSLWREWLLFAN